MHLSVESGTMALEPAHVVRLRRLLDLALGGFALCLGWGAVPAEICLALVVVCVAALQLCGAQVLRRTVVEAPLVLAAIALAAAGLGAGAPAAGLLAPGAIGLYRLASIVALVGAVGDPRRGWRLLLLLLGSLAARGIFAFLSGAADGTALAFGASVAFSFAGAALLAGAVRGRGNLVLLLLAGVAAGTGWWTGWVDGAGWALIGAACTLAAVGRRGMPAALLLAVIVGAIHLATGGDGDGSQRLASWARGLELLAGHPATGTGCAEAGCAYQNQLLTAWTGSGPLGLLALIWLLVTVVAALRRGFKRVEGEGHAATLILGSAGATVAFLLLGHLHDPLYDGTNALLLALAIALGLAAAPHGRSAPVVDSAPPAPRGSAAVSALAITLAALGGLNGLEEAGRGEGKVALFLLLLLGAGHLPGLPQTSAARLRGLATLAGAVVLAARAFDTALLPGSEAWWSTPASLASVAASIAGMAGSAWAMRRPGEVGPAAVAGALAAGWVVAWMGGYDLLGPSASSYNFALAGCAAGLLFVAWAGPLGFGEGRVLDWAERLRRLPAAAVGVALAAVAIAGWF